MIHFVFVGSITLLPAGLVWSRWETIASFSFSTRCQTLSFKTIEKTFHEWKIVIFRWWRVVKNESQLNFENFMYGKCAIDKAESVFQRYLEHRQHPEEVWAHIFKERTQSFLSILCSNINISKYQFKTCVSIYQLAAVCTLDAGYGGAFVPSRKMRLCHRWAIWILVKLPLCTILLLSSWQLSK